MNHARIVCQLDHVAFMPESVRVGEPVIAQRITFPNNDERRRQSRQILAYERRIAEILSIVAAGPVMVVKPEDRLAREQVVFREFVMRWQFLIGGSARINK